MKQGITFLMPIRIGMDIDLIDKIEFKFKQGETERKVLYPSDECILRTGRVIDIIWTSNETYRFRADDKILLDTRITLKDSAYQPETAIAEVIMRETLFEEGE